MKLHIAGGLRAGWLALSTIVLMAPPAPAEEPMLPFLEGLRRRGMHDTALQYLAGLPDSKLVTTEQKKLIPYEEGVTLVEQAGTLRDAAEQKKLLDAATAKFERFIKANSEHLLTPSAGTHLGNILVIRGRTLLATVDSVPDLAQKKQQIADGRKLLTEAQARFAEAETRFAAKEKTFPRFTDDKAVKDAREQALRDLIGAQLYSAGATYELARSYPAESADFKKVMKAAADKYQQIYEKYRQRIAGLYARMYQGRCYQELGNTKQALSYYRELLSQPDESQGVPELKSKTLRLAMQCWLHPNEKKWDETIERGEEWLKKVRGAEAQSPEAASIRWLTATAYRQKANSLQESDAAEKAKKDQLLKQFLAHAQTVAKLPGDHQQEARAAMAELGRTTPAGGEPTNFAEAKEAGDEAVNKLQGLLTTAQLMKARDPAAAEEYEKQKDEALAEAFRLNRLAYRLRNKETNAEDVNKVLYLLTYLYLLQDDYYEAAVAGEFVARHQPQSEFAKLCGQFAVAAWFRAYQALPPNGDRDFPLRKLTEIAEYLVQHWPGTPEADEALLTPARLLINEERVDEAIAFLERLPPDSSSRIEGDLLAGQAYWRSYLEGERLPEDQRPPQEQRDKQVQQARRALARGVEGTRKGLAGAAPSYNLILSELMLAQVLIKQGDYEGAVRLLEVPETGALALIASKSPVVDKPNFAEEAYKLALRSYVGAGELGKAQNVMSALDTLVGEGGNAEDLTRVYISLGQSLQEEVQRLRDERKLDELQKVRASFQAFLERISQQEQGNTYSSLQWVAESLKGLAGSADEVDKLPTNDPGRHYFEQAAATYSKILDRAKAEPAFVPRPESLLAVKISLAECKRRLGQYQEALDLLVTVLKERPMTLEAQREAAMVYEAWGADQPAKYDRAIFGARFKKADGSVVNIVWGWNELGRVTQRYPQYRALYHEARYHVANCRVRMAQLSSSTPEKRAEELRLAEQDIAFTARLDPSLGGEQMAARYDALMKVIQGLTRRQQVGLREIIKPVNGKPIKPINARPKTTSATISSIPPRP